MPTCDCCGGRGEVVIGENIYSACKCKGTGRWPPDEKGDVMESTLKDQCGECKWFGEDEETLAVRECMNKANHGGRLVCWVRADFFGCPRFERRADWVDKMWVDVGEAANWTTMKAIVRKAAEAEFRRRMETAASATKGKET